MSRCQVVTRSNSDAWQRNSGLIADVWQLIPHTTRSQIRRLASKVFRGTVRLLEYVLAKSQRCDPCELFVAGLSRVRATVIGRPSVRVRAKNRRRPEYIEILLWTVTRYFLISRWSEIPEAREWLKYEMLARWGVNAASACEIVTLLRRIRDPLSVWKKK